MRAVDPVQEAVAVVLNGEGISCCGDVDESRTGALAVLEKFGKYFIDAVVKNRGVT